MASFNSTSRLRFARASSFFRKKPRWWPLVVLIGPMTLVTGDFRFGLAASAQTLDDYARQRVFDFEQCANACQIDLDQQLFLCAPYREDKSRPAPEDCYESNYDAYEQCMKACPVDPRKQP